MIRSKLILGLSLLVILLGAMSAFVGVQLIRNRVVQEAQTRVELDLSSAWSVYNARLEETETILRLIASGQLLSDLAPPYKFGDYPLSHMAILKALEGEEVTATELLYPEELDRENEGLAEILGAVYGGVLLNKNHRLVDSMRDTVFTGRGSDEPTPGTVTIFLHDSRIATTVLLSSGNRALGTRVSKEVADRVLDSGLRWTGRAFVVNDWYLTAYDPIRDSSGRVIGMLYVGILERPFAELTRKILFRYALLSAVGVALALVLAFFLASRLARPIHQLAGAARKMQAGEPHAPVPVRRGAREIRLLVTTFNDMAETLTPRESSLKEANEKLGAANLSLRNLNQGYMETVGFISHELKYPLATMLNYLYLLQEKQLGPLTEPQRQAVRAVDGNVHLLAEMVRHYLNLSRIENGTFGPEPVRLAVRQDVLDPLVETITPALRSRGMQRECSVPGELFVLADRSMTREVFENLLSNAVKYGREGGLIRVRGGPAGDRAQFAVFNEGQGVPEDRQGALFQRFSRVVDPSARTQRGTGLGLYITRHIIEAHGGKVSVASEAGKWIEFSFDLPSGRDE